MRLYEVNKTVVWGSDYIEHQYKDYGNSLVGSWAKYGTLTTSNPSIEDIVCMPCVRDTNRRIQNYANLDIFVPGSSSTRSYRVIGATKAEDFYDWSYGICKNMRTDQCWGYEHDYTFNIQRKPVANQSAETQYKFANRRFRNGILNRENNLFIKVRRSEGNYKKYWGIGWKFTPPTFIWPGLFKLEDPSSGYYVYLEMDSKYPVPTPHLPNTQWSSLHRKRGFLYESILTFRFFKANQKVDPPTTLEQLKVSHKEVNKTFMDIFPGSSGMRIQQFVYRENTDTTRKCKTKQIDWITEDEEDYVGKDNRYVPGYQSGFAGPFVSYFVRRNDVAQYFQ